MKKIIFSTYDSLDNPYYNGGGSIAVQEVCKRLKSKFIILVISGKYHESKDKKYDGIDYKFIGFNTSIPQLDQFIFSVCLPFYIITQKFDIWIESFTPPFSAGFLQIFTKKPVIGLAHMLSGEDMKRKYKLPFDVIEKIGLKTYKYFIVNTESAKSKILRQNKKADIKIVGNGIEKTRKNNDKNGYALYIGRIEINQKGLDLLVNVWKNINKRLVIAGEKGEYEKLKDLVLKNKLQNKIDLVGNVTGSAKDKLFKDASFVVAPSRFETFSISTLEAFSYGLPVVCFDIDGLKWTPQGATLKVHPFNIVSFTNSCNTLFRNKRKRKKMGEIGQLYAKNNTWGNISIDYKNYILKVTHNNI